jgi:hypothetical protein
MGGYDTACYITDSFQSEVVKKYGAPNYWLRYFTPTPGIDKIDADPIPECQAIWDSGGPHLGPITGPTQTNLNGDKATGQADAEAFVDALTDVYLDVGPLQLPGNGILWCWLDQEPGFPLSSGYWDGWASTIRGTNFDGLGTYLYPCLYCTPHADDSCTVVDNASGSATCYGVWSPEPNAPQTCGTDLNNPPSGSPTSCAAITSVLWQFLIAVTPQHYCDLAYMVDMDVSFLNFANQCFYLNARP